MKMYVKDKTVFECSYLDSVLNLFFLTDAQ